MNTTPFLFRPFVEEQFDDRFKLSCGNYGFPCPKFGGETSTICDWIPSKSFAKNRQLLQSENDNSSTNDAATFHYVQRTVPICIPDVPFPNKTPIWTSRNLVAKHKRDKCIIRSSRLVRPLNFAANAPTSTEESIVLNKQTPVWFDALALNEVDTGPFDDSESLANCLACIVDKDDDSCVVAFSSGRLNDALSVSTLDWHSTEENHVNCTVGSRSVEYFESTIVNVDVFGRNNFLCQTDENLHFLNWNDKLEIEKKFSINHAVHCMALNQAYGEIGLLLKDKQTFLHGSLGGSDGFFSEKGTLKFETQLNSIHWSDNPNCVYLTDENNVYLVDVRSTMNSANPPKFWFTSSTSDVIRCVQPLENDSQYLLVLTDHALFVLDQRQPFTTVFSVNQLLSHEPKILDYSQKINNSNGANRLITIASRESNERICVPLLWNAATSTICELDSPFDIGTPESGLLWFETHVPSIPVSANLERRCLSPLRGIRTIQLENERQLIQLCSNDVGDLYFSCLNFADRKNVGKNVWDFEAVCWRMFIETRSALYVEHRPVCKDFSDHFNKFRRDSFEREDENLNKNQSVKCVVCHKVRGKVEIVCDGCRLEKEYAERLLKKLGKNENLSTFLNGSSASLDVEEAKLDTNDDMEHSLIDVWKNAFLKQVY